jgi:archaellum component FlaC
MTSPLLLPPLLLKRGLDDLHDLAGLARGLGSLPGKLDGLHDEIRGLREDLEPLPEDIKGLRTDLDSLPEKLDGIQKLLLERPTL